MIEIGFRNEHSRTTRMLYSYDTSIIRYAKQRVGTCPTERLLKYVHIFRQRDNNTNEILNTPALMARQPTSRPPTRL